MEVQIAEHKIKKVLLGATSFFVIFNALTVSQPSFRKMHEAHLKLEQVDSRACYCSNVYICSYSMFCDVLGYQCFDPFRFEEPLRTAQHSVALCHPQAAPLSWGALRADEATRGRGTRGRDKLG